jgi:hypothetical protein
MKFYTICKSDYKKIMESDLYQNLADDCINDYEDSDIDYDDFAKRNYPELIDE